MDKSASFDSDATELQKELLLLGPIFEKLVFTSDPLRKTYEQLRLVVYLKVPGCWLAAARGRGKTIAIEYCARRLRAEIPGLPLNLYIQRKDEEAPPRSRLQMLESLHTEKRPMTPTFFGPLIT